MKHTNHFKKGFTAVELFFVIVVIVALAAFLIPHFMNLKNVKKPPQCRTPRTFSAVT